MADPHQQHLVDTVVMDVILETQRADTDNKLVHAELAFRDRGYPARVDEAERKVVVEFGEVTVSVSETILHLRAAVVVHRTKPPS